MMEKLMVSLTSFFIINAPFILDKSHRHLRKE